MDRRRKRAVLRVEEALELFKNVVKEKPFLPFLIPLVFLAWAVEKWIFPFSNWVTVIVAVWATVQVSQRVSVISLSLILFLLLFSLKFTCLFLFLFFIYFCCCCCCYYFSWFHVVNFVSVHNFFIGTWEILVFGLSVL